MDSKTAAGSTRLLPTQQLAKTSLRWLDTPALDKTRGRT
ncbi:hypothetical protein APY03_3688 [Variovorax sp. WDL1]|nr:hypothetical protein APY03_3688 [Variovorax sp. WDL1]